MYSTYGCIYVLNDHVIDYISSVQTKAQLCETISTRRLSGMLPSVCVVVSTDLILLPTADLILKTSIYSWTLFIGVPHIT